MKTYRCAICQKAIDYAAGIPMLYPFCSERCRLVDLGKWFRAEYAIERAMLPEESPPTDPRLSRPESDEP